MEELRIMISKYNNLIAYKENLMTKSLFIMKCAKIATVMIFTIPIAMVLFIVSCIYIGKVSKCNKKAKELGGEILYELIVNKGENDLIEIDEKYSIDNNFVCELDHLLVNHPELNKYQYDSTRTKIILK